ncbi:endonuclease III domain-containing protein, partial [Ligilactobacillus saerimneri]|uniref:endonuclease III domain-containing protein n=1 Tax=Ligilactobacillus saerimneri TaxID=228229 RepID=UPI003C6CE24A
MLSKDQIELAIATMQEKYPQARASLVADTDFHFLLAVILSAQATDKSVNLVTPAVFARFPTPND